MDVATVLKQTEGMPIDDQIELVCRIWERIADSGWQPRLTEELRAELDRRSAEAEANPDEGYTWEEVVEYVKRKK